ncbi:MAG: toll/interleukin-1 receptor domain-containing protein [Candidatus Atribacteria bacterium]|nr:toll/interleukin-1 receptor domain-containing protein [Candidatus Atribacteria bacterium]
MINKENEIERLFNYTDLLVAKKNREVLKILEKDKNNIRNEMEKRGLTNSGFPFGKLINRELEVVEEIVNYQIDCDLNELSASLTKDICDKIYLRAKSLAKIKLNIVNDTLKKYERFCNRDKNQVISMKNKCDDKIAYILNSARTEIEIRKRKFEIEMTKDHKIRIIDDIMQNNQKKDKIEENNKKSKIFLSYSHKDKEIADRVDKFFISKNIRLTRDVRDAPPYSSLKKFMDTIRDHDYVIMLISDAYLKSTDCMYEVIQFIQERNYSDRTFPIVIDNEATIFNRSEHSKYIHYWQKKYKELGEEIKTLQNTGTISLHKELDKIDKIQSNIGDFLNKISDLKCIPLDELERSNYKDIISVITIYKKQEDNLMTNKNNEKMLYKIYLIASIVLAIVLIIYYTTPWIKDFITYYKETKGDVITNKIIEGSEKIEEGIHSLGIKDKEIISLEPRILVFVPEMYAGKEISDNSAEIAIINGLLKAGFVVINKHERDDISQDPLIKRVLKEDKQATLELAMQYGANVVIDGKAISEKTGMISDFHSVRAYLEIQAYKTDEDKVIAAHSLQVSRAGITEDSAYKTAFNLAGEQMADYLVEKLAEFRNPEEIRTINLFIDNLRNNSQLEKLREAIGKMLLVIEVKVNLLENEKAELIIKTLGDVQELNEDLGNLTFINLEIKKVNDNFVQITVK